MHTRFNAGHVGGEQISGLASSAGARATALYETYYFTRITQANGLPLLVLLIVHLSAHTFIRCAFVESCGGVVGWGGGARAAQGMLGWCQQSKVCIMRISSETSHSANKVATQVSRCVVSCWLVAQMVCTECV